MKQFESALLVRLILVLSIERYIYFDQWGKNVTFFVIPVLIFSSHMSSLNLYQHHCRNCGDIFCDKCTQGRVALTADEDAQPVRVCDRCMVCASKIMV